MKNTKKYDEHTMNITGYLQEVNRTFNKHKASFPDDQDKIDYVKSLFEDEHKKDLNDFIDETVETTKREPTWDEVIDWLKIRFASEITDETAIEILKTFPALATEHHHNGDWDSVTKIMKNYKTLAGRISNTKLLAKAEEADILWRALKPFREKILVYIKEKDRPTDRKAPNYFVLNRAINSILANEKGMTKKDIEKLLGTTKSKYKREKKEDKKDKDEDGSGNKKSKNESSDEDSDSDSDDDSGDISSWAGGSVYASSWSGKSSPKRKGSDATDSSSKSGASKNTGSTVTQEKARNKTPQKAWCCGKEGCYAVKCEELKKLKAEGIEIEIKGNRVHRKGETKGVFCPLADLEKGGIAGILRREKTSKEKKDVEDSGAKAAETRLIGGSFGGIEKEDEKQEGVSQLSVQEKRDIAKEWLIKNDPLYQPTDRIDVRILDEKWKELIKKDPRIAEVQSQKRARSSESSENDHQRKKSNTKNPTSDDTDVPEPKAEAPKRQRRVKVKTKSETAAKSFAEKMLSVHREILESSPQIRKAFKTFIDSCGPTKKTGEVRFHEEGESSEADVEDSESEDEEVPAVRVLTTDGNTAECRFLKSNGDCNHITMIGQENNGNVRYVEKHSHGDFDMNKTLTIKTVTPEFESVILKGIDGKNITSVSHVPADIGSQVNCITKKYAEKLEEMGVFWDKKYDFSLRSANGQVDKTLGLIPCMKVGITDNHTVDIACLVTSDNCSYGLLLGCPFLKDMGAIIRWNGDKLEGRFVGNNGEGAVVHLGLGDEANSVMCEMTNEVKKDFPKSRRQ
jgi:hypothetical protein